MAEARDGPSRALSSISFSPNFPRRKRPWSRRRKRAAASSCPDPWFRVSVSAAFDRTVAHRAIQELFCQTLGGAPRAQSLPEARGRIAARAWRDAESLLGENPRQRRRRARCRYRWFVGLFSAPAAGPLFPRC